MRPLLLLCACGEPPEAQFPDADPALGAELIRHHGCGSCHRIPGIAGAHGQVGPPLTRIARRAYLGGVLPNQPESMVLWLLNPPAAAPGSAMPVLGLSEAEARAIAAYLYTLR